MPAAAARSAPSRPPLAYGALPAALLVALAPGDGADRREQVGADPCGRAGPQLVLAPSPALLGSKTSSTKRSCRSRPTIMCCHSGTGRCSETTTSTSPRTSFSHAPNSSALLTVADSEATSTCGGRWMMTSSNTAPRNRSAR